jgi:hypothetical protein
MSIFVTNTNWRGNNLPREADEHETIAVGSPLAVIGLFVLALQHRFSPSSVGSVGLQGSNPELRDPVSWEDEEEVEPLPWIWTGDLRPADECVPGNAGAPRPIYIGPAFEKNKGARNYRPALFVDRGTVTIQKLAINNEAGRHLQSGLQAYGSIAKVPIEIECVSESYADCSILADTVWFYILSCRNVLSAAFGFHQIVEPVLAKTLPSEEDKQVFHTQIYCDVELVLRWSTRPIKPLINDVVLRVGKMGSPDEALVDIVLRESRS